VAEEIGERARGRVSHSARPASLGHMAYAFLGQGTKDHGMVTPETVLPDDGETIAELRELYRAAEARAARLRLLSAAGRDLTEAGSDDLDTVLCACARRLAFFLGRREAELADGAEGAGIAIQAPGADNRIIARLRIDDLDRLEAIPDAEDRDAVRMHLELMGATIDRVRKDRERARLLTELTDREKRLEALLEQIFTAQEEERRRVAYDLHDGVAQTATALVRMLESAGGDSAHPHTAPSEVARMLVTELRCVIAGLRPTLLDDLGLLPALQFLAEGLEAEGYAVSISLPHLDTRLAPGAETALFRIAQEAIANIRKHAGDPCDVAIVAKVVGDAFTLRIEDSGRGPSEATRNAAGRAGYNVGIEGMKERMSALGGTLDWSAGAMCGVVVEARLPLAGKAHE